MDKTIGGRLRELRNEWGFSQKHIAYYLGFKQSQIAKLENDDRKISSSDIRKLCRLYCCEEMYLAYGVGEYEKPNFAFKSNKKNLDLETLSQMNRIILNLNELDELNGD